MSMHVLRWNGLIYDTVYAVLIFYNSKTQQRLKVTQ